MFSYLISVFITWLNPQVSKMKRTLHSDWLLEQARWAHLSHSGNPLLFPQVNYSFWPCNKSTNLVQSRQLDIKWPPKKELGQYPAILTECWSITHNYLEQWLNFVNIFSKKAFYIAFKGLCYAIFCSLRGLNVSWHKLNFRNNGPVLLFTALFTKMWTLNMRSRLHNWFFCCRQLQLQSQAMSLWTTKTHKADRNQPITNHDLLNPLSSVS